MSAFIPVMRGALLWLSRQQNLRRWMEISHTARRLTERFVAGTTLEDAIRVSRQLQASGFLVSLDYLGENVKSLAEADASLQSYQKALERIQSDRLPATVSMKVTSLGLDLSEEACSARTEILARQAQAIETRVECDMEDSSYTDRNLRIVSGMHVKTGSVRAVIQSYLYRSEKDIEDLSKIGVPVRLCKGAYREPVSVAWQEKSEVDRSYVTLMEKLFRSGVQPAIATHDQAMIDAAIGLAKSNGVSAQGFEFQMLYGVQRQLQRKLKERGFQVRLYVPYGEAWYPYFMRRLAERPANVGFMLRALANG